MLVAEPVTEFTSGENSVRLTRPSMSAKRAGSVMPSVLRSNGRPIAARTAPLTASFVPPPVNMGKSAVSLTRKASSPSGVPSRIVSRPAPKPAASRSSASPGAYRTQCDFSSNFRSASIP